MRLFLENGYINMHDIMLIDVPFIFVVGARGTGKTYGALYEVYTQHLNFIYMRRTQAQADLINKPDFSPFKSINRDLNVNVVTVPINKYTSAFYNSTVNDNGKVITDGAAIGHTLALSTVSNVRGFDSSDIDVIVYDEFIPEYHEKSMKAEGEALMNAYETINRNRELSGRPPVKLMCLANSNRLDNPIFVHLQLVDIAAKMQNDDKDIYIDTQRGFAIISIHDSPISEQKAGTALYRLTNNDTFIDMALNNRFVIEDEDIIKSRSLRDYKQHVSVGEICIYKHKSRKEYYCCKGKPFAPYYQTGHADLKRFQRDHFRLWVRYMDKQILFADAYCRALFVDYFGK